MKPFHFYLFLFFACWLQPQVLPAQDNRLAERFMVQSRLHEIFLFTRP